MATSTARFLLLGVSLSAFACSQVACTAEQGEDEATEETSSEIVGGVASATNAWPGTVALYKGSFACGGSLVAPSWVLTAAHCVSSSSTTGGITKVVIGRNRLSATGGQNAVVDRAFRHPSYSSSTMANDIALLHLKTPSTFPLAKIVLPAQVASVVSGASSTVVGWGTTSESGSVSDVLREVSVPVISNEMCKTYSGYSRLSDTQVCAVYPTGGKDSCQGDSGGPLFMKLGTEFRQVGLVSWGIGCARANAPGVYTRVGTFLPWLKTTSNGEIVTEPATVSTTDAGTAPAADEPSAD